MMIKEYDQRDMIGENAFTLGAWLHHSFECAHPFSDGNGRVGRLLMNLHFLKHNWPPVNVLPEDRDRYLNALLEGNEGNMSALTDYLKIVMGGSLLNFLAPVGTEQDELRPLVKFQRNVNYSAKYMSLRARQGELPAVRIRNEWNTTQRALDLYIDEVRKK
jgi:Fic family protein